MGILRRSLVALASMVGMGGAVGQLTASQDRVHIEPKPIFNSHHSRGKGGRKMARRTTSVAAMKRQATKRRNKRKNPRGCR